MLSCVSSLPHVQTAILEAEAASRLSRRFLANVSHELRTPLNSVIAYNTLILDEEKTSNCCKCEEAEEHASSALTSAEALLGIINQILDYAQMDNEEQV
jgi:signal transduction histidine kinase